MAETSRKNHPAVMAPAIEVFWRYLAGGWFYLAMGAFWSGVGVACYTVLEPKGLSKGDYVICGVFLGIGLCFLALVGWRAGLAGFVAWRGRMIQAAVIATVKDPRSPGKNAKALKYLFVHPETKEKIRGVGPSLRRREIFGRVWRNKDRIIVAYLPWRPQWSAVLSRVPYLRPERAAPSFTVAASASGAAPHELLLARHEATNEPRESEGRAAMKSASEATASSPAGKDWKMVKVVILGAKGTGKTTFAEHFQTSISQDTGKAAGVRVFKATIRIAEGERIMMLWDVDGETSDAMRRTFSASAGGFVLVSDASQPATRDAALKLLAELGTSFPRVPAVLFENHRGLPKDVSQTPAFPPGVVAQSGDARKEEDAVNVLRVLHKQIAQRERET